MHYAQFKWFLVAATLGFTACSEEQLGLEHDSPAVSQPVIGEPGGSLAVVDLAMYVTDDEGHLLSEELRQCSGVIVSSRTVLTAAHCVQWMLAKNQRRYAIDAFYGPSVAESRENGQVARVFLERNRPYRNILSSPGSCYNRNTGISLPPEYDIRGTSRDANVNRAKHDVALITFGRDFGVRPAETLVGRMNGTSQPGSSAGWPAAFEGYGPSEPGEPFRNHVRRQRDLPPVGFETWLTVESDDAGAALLHGDSGGPLTQAFPYGERDSLVTGVLGSVYEVEDAEVLKKEKLYTHDYDEQLSTFTDLQHYARWILPYIYYDLDCSGVVETTVKWEGGNRATPPGTSRALLRYTATEFAVIEEESNIWSNYLLDGEQLSDVRSLRRGAHLAELTLYYTKFGETDPTPYWSKLYPIGVELNADLNKFTLLIPAEVKIPQTIVYDEPLPPDPPPERQSTVTIHAFPNNGVVTSQSVTDDTGTRNSCGASYRFEYHVVTPEYSQLWWDRQSFNCNDMRPNQIVRAGSRVAITTEDGFGLTSVETDTKASGWSYCSCGYNYGHKEFFWPTPALMACAGNAWMDICNVVIPDNITPGRPPSLPPE